MRLQAESVEASLKAKKALAPLRRPAPSASAPSLGMSRSAGEAKEGLQRKMDLLNLMNGYSKNLSNLTPEQTAGLLSQLNAGNLFGGRRSEATTTGRGGRLAVDEEAAAGEDDDGCSRGGGEDEEEPELGGAPSFLGAEAGHVAGPGSLQDRLRSLNEECTRVFEADLDALDDLDL